MTRRHVPVVTCHSRSVPSQLVDTQCGRRRRTQLTCALCFKKFHPNSIRRFVIMEKAPTRAFSWLKATTTAFTFKTLLRHYGH